MSEIIPIPETNIEPTLEKQESKSEYNFELIKGLEPAMVSLVEQLKNKIEAGEYSLLLSDDTGGRIPTLILRKIMKEKGPEKDLKTYFLASGRDYHPDKVKNPEEYKKLMDYLKSLDFGKRRTLIVTQYIGSGGTLRKIGSSLEDVGGRNFDFATVGTDGNGYDFLKNFGGADQKKSDFFEGGHVSGFANGHSRYSGIGQAKEYSPIPIKKAKSIKEKGARELTSEDYDEIFGITKGDNAEEKSKKQNNLERRKEYERIKNSPLTAEEEQEIQRKVNLAREDVATMARRVIEQVWK